MRSNRYQYALIFLGASAFVMFGIFLYREIFPEYRIYQNDYIVLEKFRTSYTGEQPPLFETGIKQIVIEREDKGPATIDRCISCHVALDIEYFSPSKIERDANGNIVWDKEGNPSKVKNDDFIWDKLDQKIAELTDQKVIEQLKSEGRQTVAEERLSEARRLTSLKTAHVGDRLYDVTKVLAMHPLIGKETRPFEFHPLTEFGCVSCHNGNGRGLTTEKAHGPVVDGQYEKEDLGPEPKFIESDPKNDPKFSQLYNGKPGAKLLFQTTPIYVGPIMQAKCVQCHQPSETALHDTQKYFLRTSAKEKPIFSGVDLEIKNFHQGEELYISQACYACHRISNFSRGGVGPDLSKIGDYYPWYIKRKIMWPQGDFSTSTMPNEKLDPEDLQDLMVFLLAQKGVNKNISDVPFRTSIQEWEAGKRKMPWEQPVPPSKIHDLSYSMIIFATEGCAACHRLKGYESNVGYAIEKEGTPDISELYQEEEWFTKLFPEEVEGSQIVSIVETHADEIDKRIVDNVRSHSILEEIEKSHPNQIEAFYTPFSFAERAKNFYFTEQIKNETDINKKSILSKQHQEWKERIRRIRMMFIQTYGLGRLICPRLNWSGVFRSDEWLMEHFRNPGAHSPNSLMPVFPFDDTKFYALTYMLNILGERNTKSIQRKWSKQGFDPELAFQMHCSQCHGTYRAGNGPIATWIYPIPKNLDNSEFLRNLTKERAIQSITHGIKGTPMPPWGEVHSDKPINLALPVLTKNEIQRLVDWLYSTLPGESVFRGEPDVPKWGYSPEDLIQELKNEGGAESLKEISHEKLALSNLFDIIPNNTTEPQKDAYYIKQEYYTPKNIEQGKVFFEMNCALCHGREANGTGSRAEFMTEAKPRMLTNLDWLQTRDDLRLLRSIKYGVPGTAMTPWGDLTTSLQRIQLVIFIRSLTKQQEDRDKLLRTLYQTFDTALYQIEQARIKEYKSVERITSEYEYIESELEKIRQEISQGKTVQSNAKELFEKELLVLKDLQKQKDRDALFVEFKKTVHEELDIYQKLGLALLAKEDNPFVMDCFLQIVELNRGRFLFANDHLEMNVDNKNEEKKLKAKSELITYFSKKIEETQKEKVIWEGKLPSLEQSQQLAHVNGQLKALTQLRDLLEKSLEEAQTRLNKEQNLYNQMKDKK